MLKYLHIRDFTIITETEMELQSGMTALTGETGAGKSILLDAIALVLGDRMDVSSVRAGSARAEISAGFAPPADSPAWAWMTEHDLDDDDQCLLRRIVSAEGKSRGYVNGRPVSMQMLRSLGEMLVDIHGQHEHFALTRKHTQRAVLDGLLGRTNLPSQVATAYQRWHESNRSLNDYAERHQRRSERIDSLRFQLQEFDSLQADQQDPAALEREFARAENAGKLLELCSTALHSLENDSQGAEAGLSEALRHLQHLESLDGSVREITEMIDTAVILTNEAASALRDFSGQLEVDPARLTWLDEHLSSLYRLAQKHQAGIEELSGVEQRLRNELTNLDADDISLEDLTRERDARWEVYLAQAKKLSRLRNKTARVFSQSVTEAMQALGMPGGVFECVVESNAEHPTQQGIDTVRFLTSPNPGTQPGEISRIASGGELSRISLAIALASSSDQQMPT
ncbi:MAG: DNA repair protein RecN, partial [Gammaproteobacteria bacterium]|nr:DNA repair protein RecN [Gammaproteobacteria bacterium]